MNMKKKTLSSITPLQDSRIFYIDLLLLEPMLPFYVQIDLQYLGTAL